MSRVLQEGQQVVTPSGLRASVIRVDQEGFVDLRYVESKQLGTVHEKLLRPWRAGREAPPPVRCDELGKVVG